MAKVSTAQTLQRSLYIGNAVSGILYALQLNWCFRTIDHLKSSTRSGVKLNFYIAFSIMLGILRAFELGNSLYSYYVLINRDPNACKVPSLENSPSIRKIAKTLWWVNTLGICATSIASVMAQALLVYRYYSMMSFTVYTAVPSFMFVASSVHNVAYIIQRLIHNRFTANISDQVNPVVLLSTFYATVAAVIIFHIPYIHGQIDMAGILVETALPLAIIGVPLSVLHHKSRAVVLGFAVAQTSLVGLISQLIIWRIVIGISWS